MGLSKSLAEVAMVVSAAVAPGCGSVQHVDEQRCAEAKDNAVDITFGLNARLGLKGLSVKGVPVEDSSDEYFRCRGIPRLEKAVEEVKDRCSREDSNAGAVLAEVAALRDRIDAEVKGVDCKK